MDDFTWKDAIRINDRGVTENGSFRKNALSALM